jgi:hypothetical protein
MPPQPPLCTPPEGRSLERPFAFGGETVTTPAVGDLISVALPTITTPGRRLPRGAVQIYSDNPDEVTGVTLNGVETGGTWTKVSELLGVTAVPTADRPCSSPRCRPPARSQAAASTEPDHAGELGSLTFGFLRGKPA